MVVPAQVGHYNWSFDRPGHTYTHLRAGITIWCFCPTRGLDTKVSISAGLSSQRSESETKPHMASQTASHLQRRLPILGSSQDFSAIKMLRVRGDIDECDCKSGQEPGVLARGGVAAWQSRLLDHSGPLGAAETERAKLIWVLHQVIGSNRHHGCVVRSGWSLGMDNSIYPHHCLPAGFVTCVNAAELAVVRDPICLTGPHSTLA